MVLTWFSHGSHMVLTWFSHGSHMVPFAPKTNPTCSQWSLHLSVSQCISVLRVNSSAVCQSARSHGSPSTVTLQIHGSWQRGRANKQSWRNFIFQKSSCLKKIFFCYLWIFTWFLRVMSLLLFCPQLFWSKCPRHLYVSPSARLSTSAHTGRCCSAFTISTLHLAPERNGRNSARIHQNSSSEFIRILMITTSHRHTRTIALRF